MGRGWEIARHQGMYSQGSVLKRCLSDAGHAQGPRFRSTASPAKSSQMEGNVSLLHNGNPGSQALALGLATRMQCNPFSRRSPGLDPRPSACQTRALPVSQPTALSPSWASALAIDIMVAVCDSSSSGPNQWRDSLRPSQLLHLFSLHRNCRPPIYKPDQVTLGEQTYRRSDLGKPLSASADTLALIANKVGAFQTFVLERAAWS